MSTRIVPLFLAAALVFPTLGEWSIPSFPSPGVSFGGRVLSKPIPPTRCDSGNVLFYVGKGFPYSGPVMWVPGTKANTITMSAPPQAGMQIVGVFVPPALPCTVKGHLVGTGAPIKILPGFGTSW